MRVVTLVRTFLVPLGDRDAISWVLRERRMAFPRTRIDAADRLEAGDRLLLYATRGAWRNPTRDRGRIIAYATVAGPVRRFDDPLHLVGRDFHSGCRLRIEAVVPYPGGLELQPLVDRLEAFPKPEAWSVYLRRTLVPLSDADASLLEAALDPLLRPASEAVPSYPQPG